MKAQSSSSMAPNIVFRTLKLESPSISISPKFKPTNMSNHLRFPVSDLSILESSDRSSKISNNVVIDLNDDEFGGNSIEIGDDDDCVVVKTEVNLTNEGNFKQNPVCIDENYEKEKKLKFSGKSKLGKNDRIKIDDSVQCVDDSGDDEVRIISVMPSLCSMERKRKRPFSYFSSIEIGESSGSRREEDDVFFVREVKPVVVMFMCEICADSKPRTEAFKIKGCLHSYCSDCMKTYVASKLQDGVSVINCPVPSCSGVLEPEYCRDILPFDVFVRWGNLLCESVILASQKFYCPFKDCSALLVDDGNEKVTSCECPSCYRLFCAQCKVPWHADIGCNEYQSLSKDERNEEDIMLRKLAKEKKWQRCPKCKYYVEKSQGCLYMKCRCGIAFCYSCGSIHQGHSTHYCNNCKR